MKSHEISVNSSLNLRKGKKNRATLVCRALSLAIDFVRWMMSIQKSELCSFLFLSFFLSVYLTITILGRSITITEFIKCSDSTELSTDHILVPTIN